MELLYKFDSKITQLLTYCTKLW